MGRTAAGRRLAIIEDFAARLMARVDDLVEAEVADMDGALAGADL